MPKKKHKFGTCNDPLSCKACKPHCEKLLQECYELFEKAMRMAGEVPLGEFYIAPGVKLFFNLN